MNTVNWVHFVAMLLITGALLRTIEYKWPESAVGRALGVIY